MLATPKQLDQTTVSIRYLPGIKLPAQESPVTLSEGPFVVKKMNRFFLL